MGPLQRRHPHGRGVPSFFFWSPIRKGRSRMADSLPFVATPAATKADLTALLAAVPYSTCKLHLYSNDYTPDKNTLLADLTEVIFTGYSAAALTWGTVFLDGQKVACSSAGQKSFTKSGATS